MGIDPKIKKNWIEIQKKHVEPVNAIGVQIDPVKDRVVGICCVEFCKRDGVSTTAEPIPVVMTVTSTNRDIMAQDRNRQ